MAAGIYKNGVAIIVTYQAVNVATGKTITMSVYDEAHALDAGQSGAMAEIGATGRYWKAFTPDAEGEWIIVITNTTDGGGDVVKAYAVAGHDVDEIGDDVAAIKAVTDVESGVKAVADAIQAVTDVESGVKAVADAVQAKTDLIGASVAEAGEYDTEMGYITEAVATVAKQDIIDTNVDTIVSDTGATGGIRGADSDSLKTLSDQIDAISAPAMVG